VVNASAIADTDTAAAMAKECRILIVRIFS